MTNFKGRLTTTLANIYGFQNWGKDPRSNTDRARK